MTQYVRIDSRLQAISQLEVCAAALERAKRDNNELVQAVRACHLALYSALVASLSGPANLGAFEEKLAAKHLIWMGSEDAARGAYPGDRVQEMDALLQRAQGDGLAAHFGGDALKLTDLDIVLIARLQTARHAIEHPKPGTHSLETVWLVEPLLVAAATSLWLLDHPSIRQRLLDGELERARFAVAEIERLSACALAG
jgi:hypothetical protein